MALDLTNVNLLDTVNVEKEPEPNENLTPRQKPIQISLCLELLSETELHSFLSRLNDLTNQPKLVIQDLINVTKNRGRPVGAKNKSNKREKSHFEYVDETIGQRKCRSCGISGPYARTCSK